MEQNKKDVPAQPAQPQCTSANNVPATNIAQNVANTQQQSGKKKQANRKMLALASRTYSVAIKCYTEQLPRGLDFTFNAIKNADKKKLIIMAIVHDRDIVTDGVWAAAYEKPHLHIIARCTNRKERIYVQWLLNQLGVYFRPDKDTELWRNHGVETVGNFTGYAMYLTHETEDAIAEGKELYDVEDIVSNLTPEEVAQIRAGYTRIIDNKKRLTTADLAELDEYAFQLGYNMGDFDRWLAAQPFIVRSNAKIATIRESYERGIDIRISENSKVLRVCVFIEGEGDTGKTYAAEEALKRLGRQTLTVRGGGTGKFDKLKPYTGGLVFDDDICPNVLNMSDNYICRAYRRNSNNPAWAGDFLVATSNDPFHVWAEKCGGIIPKGMTLANEYYRLHSDTFARYQALHTRFFICHILKNPETGINYLAVESPSTRGTAQEQKERADKFYFFQQKFNKIMATYSQSDKTVYYDNLIDPYFK